MQHVREIGPFKFADVQRGVNVNMLPIDGHDCSTIPGMLFQYREEIYRCRDRLIGPPQQKRELCFITISESEVLRGNSQRRPGIHVERNGSDAWGGSWGGGGVFLATDTPDSLRIWDTEIPLGLIKGGGEIEYQALEAIAHPDAPSFMAKPNTLYQISDRVPHESVPLKKDSYRRFFRFVGPDVGAWFADHSTHNPNLSLEDSGVKVIHGSKFSLDAHAAN